MVSASGSFSVPIASSLGWWFLPRMATNFLQSVWYGIAVRAGEPKPTEGSPRYIRDRRRIYILVVASYLLFTIYDVWNNIVNVGNYYEYLNVQEGDSVRAIRKQFKLLTLKYHPDKMGPGSEHVFMVIKTANDVLIDDVKRFSYERFGPSITEPDWKFCHTYSDYLYRGLWKMIPGYSGSLLFLLILSGLGKLEYGKYVRNCSSSHYFLIFLALNIISGDTTALFALFTFELAIITRPYYLNITYVIHFFTRRILLPFELIQLAHQAVISFFIALSQLGPFFQAPKPSTNDQKYEIQLERLQAFARASELETRKWAAMELAPFIDKDGEVVGSLKTTLKDWLIERRVTSEPEVRNAIGRVVAKRNAHGPKGAKT